MNAEASVPERTKASKPKGGASDTELIINHSQLSCWYQNRHGTWYCGGLLGRYKAAM